MSIITVQRVVPVRGSTTLRAGDELLALTDPERTPDLAPVFTRPRDPRDPGSTP